MHWWTRGGEPAEHFGGMAESSDGDADVSWTGRKTCFGEELSEKLFKGNLSYVDTGWATTSCSRRALLKPCGVVTLLEPMVTFS